LVPCDRVDVRRGAARRRRRPRRQRRSARGRWTRRRRTRRPHDSAQRRLGGAHVRDLLSPARDAAAAQPAPGRASAGARGAAGGAGLSGQARTVAALGAAQTLAWASSYYLPAVLAAPMARDLGVAMPTVFAAFSAALLVSAALGPHAGAAIDRWGGRPVLIATNVLFALGLAGLGAARGAWG